jgi:hypothetical protein
MCDYDVIIVPVIHEWAQKIQGTPYLSLDAKMIVEAIDILSRQSRTFLPFIISGGPGHGIFYDNSGLFGKHHPKIKEPIFSFDSYAKADNATPLALAFKEELVACRQVPERIIFTEMFSLLEYESAEAVDMILGNRFTSLWGNKKPKIGLLARLWRMPILTSTYKKQGIQAEPIFVEDVLARQGSTWTSEISRYYADKSQNRLIEGFTVTELMSHIHSGTSVGELLWRKWHDPKKVNGARVRAENKYQAAERLGLGRDYADKVERV